MLPDALCSPSPLSAILVFPAQVYDYHTVSLLPVMSSRVYGDTGGYIEASIPFCI